MVKLSPRGIFNAIVFFLFLFSFVVDGVDVEIYGKIRSCQGWALDKKPELKNFIRYGGAFSFENVEIEYETGKRATLTIYTFDEHGVKQQETEMVDLQGIETEAEMSQIMLYKGFRLKPEEELVRIRRIGAEARAKEEDERNERMDESKRRMEAYMRKKAQAGGEGNANPASSDVNNDGDAKQREQATREFQMEQWKRAKERYAKDQAATKDKAHEGEL